MADSGGDDTAALLASLSRRLAVTASRDRHEASPQRWSYREAAAVLHCFDPGRLRPVDPILRVASPRGLLWRDMVPAVGRRESGLYTLKPEVREAALRRLGDRIRMRAALAANPDRPETETQRMLESCLEGGAPTLDGRTWEELSQASQVIAWLGGVLDDLPPAAQIRDELARRSVLRPFEHLVHQGFVGRTSELARLRDHVGVLAPDSWTSSAVRYARTLLRRRPMLLVHGPGGIGKSALLGRFLCEHAPAPPVQRLPFAYLSFDNPLLRIGEPFTLLIEAAEQVARQYPERGDVHQRFRSFVGDFRKERTAQGGRASTAASRGHRLEDVARLDESLFREFAALLAALTGAGEASRPALLVLDTFEAVQYRSPPVRWGLARMLGILQDALPSLRIVASGRIPAADFLIDGKPPAPLPLADLDRGSAVELLRLQGVAEDDLARVLVDQLGGNPLTLRLAARAVTSHPEMVGSAGVEGLTTRRYLLLAVPHELVQGQLYARVLDHIRDPDVRKLAHPGMVLRRVTPAAIREVLSGPCGVEIPDDETAGRLFEQMREEHALVRLEDSDTLQIRPEIRQPMLRLLERDRPGQVREIHRAAVEFWARRGGTQARAEELYHRLALDEVSEELEKRWLPAAAASLASACDDLPLRAATWLASHLGLALDPHTQKAADQADWERSVGRQAVHLLRYREVEEALQLLGERPERLADSALYALEARAHLLKGDVQDALDVVERGLATLPVTGNPGRHAELLWLHAQAAAVRERFDLAEASLAQADIVARGIADPLCRLQLAAQRLLLRRRSGGEEGAVAPLRELLASCLDRLNAEQMDRERALVRLAAAELTPQHVAAVRRVVAAVGLGPLAPVAEATLRAQLGAAAPGSIALPIDALVRRAFAAGGEGERTAAAVITGLRSQGLSLAAANLAGIEDYREPWEREISPEVTV